MKITDIFVSQERTFSFEFFPPRDEISAVDFGINVGQLMRLSPSFVTVTYGAGGSTQGRTFNLVDYLQNKIGLTTVAHYTCVGSNRDQIAEDLRYLQSVNIENLMLVNMKIRILNNIVQIKAYSATSGNEISLKKFVI